MERVQPMWDESVTLPEVAQLLKIAQKVAGSMASKGLLPASSSKSAGALAEKLEAQKLIKTLEQRRNTKRRQLFDAQDDVDKKRADLIEEIERQLETKTVAETSFTLCWVVSGDGSIMANSPQLEPLP